MFTASTVSMCSMESTQSAPIAATLPRYGVTAFCPTTVACSPAELRRTLEQVRNLRAAPPGHGARVLPAHLEEDSWRTPAYRGAQPLHCLRSPAAIGKGVVTLLSEGPTQEGYDPFFRTQRAKRSPPRISC